MDKFRELADRLMAINKAPGAIYQGIVKSVDGILCTVTMGNIDIPGIRLRASESEDDSQMLTVPMVGSAVIVGSLSGDLTDLCILSVDKIDHIIINGGKLGGLINIETLTNKINALVDAFNSHTHQVSTTGTASAQTGTAFATTGKATKLNKSDFEDETIKH